MLKVKDIMTTEVVTVTPKTEVTQAARIMLDRHINGLPVVDHDGRLVGIICQSDLIIQQERIPLPSIFTLLDSLIPIRSMEEVDREVQKISAVTVDQAMTRNPVTVNTDAGIEQVATLMVKKNFHTIPVVEGGRLVGIVGKEDVLRTLMPSEEKHAN